MGVKGRRPIKQLHTEDFVEPQLIVNVEDIIKDSIAKGYVGENENVDVILIAKVNNIDIEYDILDSSKSGYLKNINNRWVIGVNKLHNRKRQRFTIAHELGHYFMHKDKNVDYEDATFFRIDNSSSIEYAANEFAAKLLMPEERIRKVISDGEKSLENLSTIFDVSIAAIKYRAISLGYKMKDNE